MTPEQVEIVIELAALEAYLASHQQAPSYVYVQRDEAQRRLRETVEQA